MACLKAALAALTLCACPAFAAETAEAPRVEERKTIIIRTDDAKSDAHDHMAKHHIKCGGEPQVDVSDEAKDKDGKIRKSRIVLCARQEASAEAVVEKLEKARARIAAVDDLSEQTKAKALAAIDAAIARQREQRSR